MESTLFEVKSQSQVKLNSSDVMNRKPNMPEEAFLQFVSFISHVYLGKSSLKRRGPFRNMENF